MSRYRIIRFTLCAFVAALGTQACDDRGTGPGGHDDSADRAALMKLYDVTNGENWTRNEGWDTDAPLGTWHGVETDASGRVVSLDLGSTYDPDTRRWTYQGLAGPIPPELGTLSQLETLVLDVNALRGPIPPELGQLSKLTRLDLGTNQLTGPIPSQLGDLTRLTELDLSDNELSGPVPLELTSLSSLTRLLLGSNDLAGEVPAGLGTLPALEVLALNSNHLTGEIPLELGQLANLTYLSLSSNSLTGSIPPELSRLANLRWLFLSRNNLTGTIPPELANLASLYGLGLQYNDLTGTIPFEFGNFGSLRRLHLAGNQLSGAIPPELADLADLDILWLSENGLTGPIPPELGNLTALEQLYLDGNNLDGAVPPEFGNLTTLENMGLTHNSALTGALPHELTQLQRLDWLLAGGTDLCAPGDSAFTAWLEGIHKRRIAPCSGGNHKAYLIQAVQSRAFPVPLVAGEEALLRVFVTAPNPGSAQMPAVRARFFRYGVETHVQDIPGNSRTIPTEVDESSLSSSVNAVIPGGVVQPGLEMVIEIDPGETLDPETGVARRIPATGRMAVEVGAMPLFDLTLVPLVWEQQPDYQVVATVTFMAADPENHELLWDSRNLLPVGGIEVTAHASVTSSSNNAYTLLRETRAIRAIEGGTGHYMGMMSPPVTEAGGVAYRPGRSSFSQPSADIIAHEFGHNFSLQHAPCGDAPGPDIAYPYPTGSTGAWGYDSRNRGHLIGSTRKDIMSYCDPAWISDYHFTNALRFRLSDADSVGLPMVAPSTESLLLWGGVDAGGAPFLEPAFVVDAPPSLPQSGGEFRVAGHAHDGAELFSLSFAMPEVADGDGSSSFVFVLPAGAGWEGTLSRITLSGPGGAATLDAESDLPMAMLRDPRTGQVRAFLRDLPGSVLTHADAAAVLSPEPGIELLFSRGIPAAETWSR